MDGEDEEDGEEEEEDGHKDEGLKEETNKEDMGGEEEEEVKSDEDRVTVRDLEVLPLMHLKEWEVVDDSITFPSCDISSELKVSFHISSTLFNFSCSLPSYIPSLPYYTVPSLPPSFIPYSSPLPSSPPLPSPPLPSPPLPSPPSQQKRYLELGEMQHRVLSAEASLALMVGSAPLEETSGLRATLGGVVGLLGPLEGRLAHRRAQLEFEKIQKVWPSAKGVAFSKGCGLQQGVWPSARSVAFSKGCGLQQRVRPSAKGVCGCDLVVLNGILFY